MQKNNTTKIISKVHYLFDHIGSSVSENSYDTCLDHYSDHREQRNLFKELYLSPLPSIHDFLLKTVFKLKEN